jgi:hypothetical protein
MDSKSDDVVVKSVLSSWKRQENRKNLTSVPFYLDINKNVYEIAEEYVKRCGGAVVCGFLVAHPPSWSSVIVRAHCAVVDVKGRYLDPMFDQSRLKDWAFVTYDGTDEDFLKFLPRFEMKETILDEPSSKTTEGFSTGQVQSLMFGFLALIAIIATVISTHTYGWKATSDYLGYSLPCAAAVVAGGKLYLGERVSELGLYECSALLLFLGMLFNAEAHICGAPVIVTMCLLVTIIFTVILVTRLFGQSKTENSFRSFAAGFSFPFCVAVSIFALFLTWIYWADFFFVIKGRAICLPE